MCDSVHSASGYSSLAVGAQARSMSKWLSWINTLKPFLDAHQGPFKRFFRNWIGILLLARGFLATVFVHCRGIRPREPHLGHRGDDGAPPDLGGLDKWWGLFQEVTKHLGEFILPELGVCDRDDPLRTDQCRGKSTQHHPNFGVGGAAGFLRNYLLPSAEMAGLHPQIPDYRKEDAEYGTKEDGGEEQSRIVYYKLVRRTHSNNICGYQRTTAG